MKMNKQIKKNKLDLEYQKYAQILNAIFIFLTTGVLGFIGSFIFLEDKDKLFIGIISSLAIIFVGYMIYKRVNKKLGKILEEVENL